MELSKENVGKRVTIRNVTNAHLGNRAKLIGQSGVVIKAVQSRGIYRLQLDTGNYWEAIPENLELADTGTDVRFAE